MHLSVDLAQITGNVFHLSYCFLFLFLLERCLPLRWIAVTGILNAK